MTLKETVVNAVAGALVLGVGGTVVSLKVSDAQQNERIERIEKLDEKMDRLSERLDRFSVDLARVQTKQEEDRVPRN